MASLCVGVWVCVRHVVSVVFHQRIMAVRSDVDVNARCYVRNAVIVNSWLRLP